MFKIKCLIMTVLLIITAMPLTVSASDTDMETQIPTNIVVYEKGLLESGHKDSFSSDEKADITKGEATRVNSKMTFMTEDKEFIISGNSNGKTVEITSYLYNGDDLVLDLELPDSITFVYVAGNYTENKKYHYEVNELTCYITSVSDAFCGENYVLYSSNTSLNLTLPARVTTIDKKAFYGNTKLSGLSFKGDIQSVGESAFEGCTRLSELDFYGLFENSAINTIPKRCFYQCSGIESITVPPTILNIEQEAFYQCNSIQTVLLPTVQSIGKNAFAFCSSLRYLYLGREITGWESIIDETSKDKVIITKASAPQIKAAGSQTEINNKISRVQTLYISGTVDITDITVTKDGKEIECEQYVNKSTYRTIGYKFTTDSVGTYSITATDACKNTITRTIIFDADAEVNDSESNALIDSFLTIVTDNISDMLK